MRIVEEFLISKNGKLEDCEDFIFFNEHFAGIIDGATSVEQLFYEDKTPGQKIGELIIEVLNSISPTANLDQVVDEINTHIQGYLKKQGSCSTNEKEKRKCMTASIALYSRHHNQVWLIGDCSILVGDMSYTNNREINAILSNARSLVLCSALENSGTIQEFQKKDIGREYIMPMLKKQYLFQNNKNHPYSYSAIDGFPVDFSKTKIVDIDSKFLIMASDGYPKLFNTLEQSEQYLKELLAIDPLLIDHYKSTKGLMLHQSSYDDRAFLKIELNP